MTLSVNISTEATVERAINGARIAAFTVILEIAAASARRSASP